MQKRIKNIAILFIATSFLMVVSMKDSYAETSRVYMASYLGLNTHTQSDFSESSVPVTGDVELKNSVTFAGALGIRATRNLRIEGEVSYRSSDLDRINFASGSPSTFKLNGDLTTALGLLNAYYDLNMGWKKVTPFVGAGIGFAYHDANIDDISGRAVDGSDSSIEFAWQVGTGLKYRIKDNMAFTGGYRYLGTADIIVDGYEFEYGSHEFRLGLEYSLPAGFLQKK